MPDLKFSEIMEMQKRLKEKHKGKWHELTPDYGRSCMLWMVEEMGEAVSYVKKRGERAIMTDPQVREAFITEFCDIMMFMSDALICYGVSAEELSRAYLKKHARNMLRDWGAEEADYLGHEVVDT